MDSDIAGESPGPPKKPPDGSVRRGHKIKRKDPQKPADFPCQRTINVRMRYGGHIQAFDCGDLELDIGDWVIIRYDDVVRLAKVTSKPIIWPADQEKKQVCLPSDRRILRLATPDDLARQAENQLKEREDREYCQSCIAHQQLSMKLVAVEITLDNFKTIFYYTAEERVDFRLLVKELVSRLRTRIEMRQIGVRHEAVMVGGMGICGRHFCCSSFLNNFSPVSVRMAKEQNLSMSTSKISGVCGRLMCCLAFESYQAEPEKDPGPEGQDLASAPSKASAREGADSGGDVLGPAVSPVPAELGSSPDSALPLPAGPSEPLGPIGEMAFPGDLERPKPLDAQSQPQGQSPSQSQSLSQDQLQSSTASQEQPGLSDRGSALEPPVSLPLAQTRDCPEAGPIEEPMGLDGLENSPESPGSSQGFLIGAMGEGKPSPASGPEASGPGMPSTESPIPQAGGESGQEPGPAPSPETPSSEAPSPEGPSQAEEEGREDGPPDPRQPG